MNAPSQFLYIAGPISYQRTTGRLPQDNLITKKILQIKLVPNHTKQKHIIKNERNLYPMVRKGLFYFMLNINWHIYNKVTSL